jgi:hypothetical protein
MIVSALLIVVLLLVFTDPWSTLRNEGKRIALKDPHEIDRIILSDDYDSTLLIREQEKWLLFGKEAVNPVTVRNLLFAAERLQINSIVTEDFRSAGAEGRRINFYKGEKRILAYDFLAFGDQYMVRPIGSEQAYYVTVAGYSNQNLEKVFSSAANHYREHLLIDLLPSDVSLIEIELADRETFHFTQDENGEIACYHGDQQTALPPESLNELSIRLLFSYFTSIRYEKKAGIPTGTLMAANAAESSIARLHVESFRGEKHTLLVFPYREAPGEEAHMFRALVVYNNDPEALVVNYIYLDVLMRDLSHYIGEK